MTVLLNSIIDFVANAGKNYITRIKFFYFFMRVNILFGFRFSNVISESYGHGIVSQVRASSGRALPGTGPEGVCPLRKLSFDS